MLVSYETKHAFLTWPSNCTLGHLSHRKENLFSHKNLHTNVHSSLVCVSQNLKTIQMCFQWLNGQASHPFLRIILLNIKRDELLTHTATWMYFKGIMPTERRQSQSLHTQLPLKLQVINNSCVSDLRVFISSLWGRESTQSPEDQLFLTLLSAAGD